MLRVAEHVERTDTGRQRRANEDAYFARSPLFAVADGMGGAQAGEVASRMAVAALEPGLRRRPGAAEERLAELVRDANAQIHALSRSDDGRGRHGHDADRRLRRRRSPSRWPTSATAAPTGCATASSSC